MTGRRIAPVVISEATDDRATITRLQLQLKNPNLDQLPDETRAQLLAQARALLRRR
jgi:hypothetical protein